MLTGILEVDQATLMDLYKFTIRSSANLMTFGPAGIGKTEMAIQAVEQCGFEFKYLNLSVLEAPDLMGLPTINEKSGKSSYALPEGFPLRSESGKPKILLVDEIDKAKPELQNPMLELFQFRSINGTPLNFQAVLATGNLPDENAFSQPVSHALTNRCGVYKVRHAFEPWQQWAVNANVNSLVVGFLSRNQSYLLQETSSEDDTAYAKCSPRSWSLAAKDLDNCDRGASVEFQEMLVAGRCGTGAAAKFKVWLEHYRHIEPMIDALVRNGKHPPDNQELDRQIVCAIAGVDAIMELSRQTPNDAKGRAEQEQKVQKTVKNVSGWLMTLPSEICVAAIKSVLTLETMDKFKLVRIPEFMKVINKIRHAMK